MNEMRVAQESMSCFGDNPQIVSQIPGGEVLGLSQNRAGEGKGMSGGQHGSRPGGKRGEYGIRRVSVLLELNVKGMAMWRGEVTSPFKAHKDSQGQIQGWVTSRFTVLDLELSLTSLPGTPLLLEAGDQLGRKAWIGIWSLECRFLLCH